MESNLLRLQSPTTYVALYSHVHLLRARTDTITDLQKARGCCFCLTADPCSL